MPRATGTYRNSTVGGETVRAFVPAALPPAGPPLRVEGPIDTACARAMAAVGRLEVAASLVPSTEWFLYGFVRKEFPKRVDRERSTRLFIDRGRGNIDPDVTGSLSSVHPL